MNNIQSVINFAYFTMNFPSDFIEKAWEGDEHMIHHLTTAIKFEQTGFFMQGGDFLRWFVHLDSGNQTKLVKWINENYRGISI